MSRKISPHTYGARGDGSTNDRVAFTAAMARITTLGGGTLELEPHRVYNLGASTPGSWVEFLGANSLSHFVVEGNGSKILASVNSPGVRARPAAFLISQTPNTRFSNLRFEDPLYNWSDDAVGLECIGLASYTGTGVICRNHVVENCHAENVATLVQIQNGDATSRLRDIRILGCTGKNVFYGIGLANNGDNVYAQAQFEDVRRATIFYGVNGYEFDLAVRSGNINLPLVLIASNRDTLDTENINGRLVFIGSTTQELIWFPMNPASSPSPNAITRNVKMHVDANGCTAFGSNGIVRFVAYINSVEQLVAGQPGPQAAFTWDNFTLDGEWNPDTLTVEPVQWRAWSAADNRLELRGMFARRQNFVPNTTRLTRVKHTHGTNRRNVMDYGARGDGTTIDSTAFANAAANIPQRGGKLVIPEANAHYMINSNFLASIPASRTCEVEWEGSVETTVTIAVPRDVHIKGTGRGFSPDSGTNYPSGGLLRAAATWPNDGSPIMVLGEDGTSTHGSRIEDFLIDGRGLDQSRALRVTSVQELSGLLRIAVYNCQHGIDVVLSDSDSNATNYIIEDLEVYLRNGSNGIGLSVINARGAPVDIRRATINQLGSPPTPRVMTGYVFLGTNINAQNLYLEQCIAGLIIGATSGSVVTRGVRVDGISGWNSTAASLADLILIQQGGGSAWTDNVEIRNVYGDASVVNLIRDTVVGATLTAADHPVCGRYHMFAGIYPNIQSGRYKAQTTLNELDNSYTLGAGDAVGNRNFNIQGAGAARFTCNAAGSTLTGFTGGYVGRRVLIVNVSSPTLTIAHQSSSSDAANRFRTAGGGNITLAQNEVAEAHYSLGSDASWLVWKP